MDSLTRAQRSALMSSIRGRRNKATELVLASLLRRYRITGWRRHCDIAGRPDFVFRQDRLAVFVDGCFWHVCPWHFCMPATNEQYWVNKFAANKARDRAVNKTLRRKGWTVIRIWEHSLSDELAIVRKIRSELGRQGVADDKRRA